MSWIVHDSEGGAFELSSDGGSFESFEDSLRNVLDRQASIRSTLAEPSNRSAFDEALVAIGVLMPGRGAHLDFASIRGEVEQALASGALQIGPVRHYFRPICDVTSFEAEPLIDYLDDEVEDLVEDEDEPEDEAEPPPEDEPPPKPTKAFEVRVVDDVGDPVEGIALEILVDGASNEVITDGDGVATLDVPGPNVAGVRLRDLDATREVMAPRWDECKEGETPPASADVVHVPVRRSWSGATLDRGVRRTLVLLPSWVCVRLLGMHFDTSKAFLLPGALRGIQRLRTIYDDHPDARVVVCGHTDTAGSKDYNLELSHERAESIIAYLTDDVDAWDAWFRADKPAEKRWGNVELQHMLKAVPSPEAPYYAGKVDGVFGSGSRSGVEQLQTDHGLPATGTVDEATRKALITDYMSKDGTTLPDGVEALPHSCGELFPASETGDSVALEANRRVDVFFFDGEIHPPWPGPYASEGEREYPAWRDRAEKTHELDADSTEEDGTTSQILVNLRSNSGCVPLSGRPYRIDVDGTVHEGVTDDDGLAAAREIPPGDYRIEVEGRTSLAASRPTGSPAVPHVLGGYFLG